MSSRRQIANAIRALSMDAVQKANSGHPGAPLGMADIAEVLWNDFLHHNPSHPQWINRDRFVLSNGHGSMLLYSLLHLTGYDVTLDDLKQFRQLNSKTPGHPEYGYTPGVETTTGPLGQGLANAIGMALAERTLSQLFNRPGHTIINHYTYIFLGDGCLMEGISHEAASFAGHQRLSKIIAFWDDNGISIDGKVMGWFTDDTPKRFESYGWHVIPAVDGHDSQAIKTAIELARAESNRPTLICCKTTIAFGSPHLAGTSDAHGSPLGEEEVAATRKQLAWNFPPFEIPNDIYAAWDAREKGKQWEANWLDQFKAYEKAYPELATELMRRVHKKLPAAWQASSDHFIKAAQEKGESIATRKASLNALNQYAPLLPELLGGSADLTGSNLTYWQDSQPITPDNPAGNYIYYGVREFGMSAIMNGVALYGGFIPYGGTFLTFADYARNAVRMAALMKQRCVFIYTHDSIGLGEDGPTHQPIEHAAMLRLTPGLSVWRPCDAVETAIAWKHAIEQSDKPSCLLLSRQNLTHQTRNEAALENIHRGGYILLDCEQQPELILIATGSEVSLAVDAAKRLQQQNKRIRVVSMLSTDYFDAQDSEYRQSVLPDHVTQRLAIEAAAGDYWFKYVGLKGRVLGLNHFGESAPAKDLFKAFGFTVEHVMEIVLEMLQ